MFLMPTLQKWKVSAITQDPGTVPTSGATNVAFSVGNVTCNALPDIPIASGALTTGPMDTASAGGGGQSSMQQSSEVSKVEPTDYVECQLSWTYSVDSPPNGDVSLRLQCVVRSTGIVVDDPHLRGFFGQQYEFCGPQLATECQGRAFNLLSHSNTLLNAQVSRHSGPDAWPYAGTWMTGLGFRYGSTLSFELGINTDVQYAVEGALGGGGGTMHALPVKGGFRALLAFARARQRQGHSVRPG
ncbi:MAG: hypothetical protein J3K34DRAFT_107639 [Monoraphidium minutum]|nr:MAG: hypothetical protein J3K34DRAFT_107639 [Monoraphidium minutum]